MGRLILVTAISPDARGRGQDHDQRSASGIALNRIGKKVR